MGRMDELIGYGREHGCSDIHLTYGMEPVARCDGELIKLSGYGTMDDTVLEEISLEILQKDKLKSQSDSRLTDIVTCYETKEGTRNRVSIYRQQKHTAIAVRLLCERIPTLEELQFPAQFHKTLKLLQGMILITGTAGSGKSTALAACIQEINATEKRHILTIEEPIEYVYQAACCMISQREVGADTTSFAEALRSALKEDADVILVGEMEDAETISAAMTAAETGRLVFAALPASDAAAAIERIVGECPPHWQNQMRSRLAAVLKAVVCMKSAPFGEERGKTRVPEVFFVEKEAEARIKEGRF